MVIPVGVIEPAIDKLGSRGILGTDAHEFRK
jgi:hypothetical protein